MNYILRLCLCLRVFRILQENAQAMPAYNCIYSKCSNTGDASALSANEEFHQLALQYMQRLDEVMQNFDNPNDLFRHLVTVADMHRPDKQNIAQNQLQVS